ncbi:MAG: prepilin-type N-terminal cleavage/methylation domain-containing protein, partial [Candidatus Kerfeldbacteria bacterium]|nr:prepilin-type N-terminal cleavage/methylation domain-containing protein [Candidatus Kerfeldbacteria bacterium]
MSNYNDHRPGFSLIEVLISTAIIALGLITVVAVMPLSLKVNKSAERASLASAYGRAKIEQILTTSYDEVNTGNLESQIRLSLIPTNPAYIMFRTTTVNYVDSN